MISPSTKTATSWIASPTTPPTSPVTIGARYVPMNGIDTPTMLMPMKPAIAPIAASGRA